MSKITAFFTELMRRYLPDPFVFAILLTLLTMALAFGVESRPIDAVVQDWGKYLGDATMATTILDRLMHRCAMLEFEGKSYRLKEAAARIAVTPE